MKIIRILIALLLFVLPIVGRFLWFYQGAYQRTSAISTPDFAAIPLSTIPTPVSDTSTSELVKTDAPRGSLVVIDAYHSNYYKSSEIESLSLFLNELGARQETYTGSQSLQSQLQTANSLLIIAPTTTYSTDEMKAITRFVRQGGNVVVISDPTRASFYDSFFGISYSNIQYVNQVVAPFRIAFREDYAYNMIDYEGNFRNLLVKDLAASPLTQDVGEVVLYGAHTLKTDQEVILSGDDNTLSSIDDRGGKLPLAALGGNGHVLALGDLSFLSPSYNEVAGNRQFTRNIASFLVGGSVPPGLENYPVLFTQPVRLLFDSETALDSSMLMAISSVQSSLQSTFDLPVSLADQPAPGFDLVVTGTFDQLDAEMLAPFIESYDLVFEEDLDETVEPTSEPFLEPASEDNANSGSEVEITPTPEFDFSDWWESDTTEEEAPPKGTITVPGIGKFKTDGVGLLLYTAGEDHSTLVLLADSKQSLINLATILIGESLSSCLKSGNTAVCSLSSSGY